MRRAALLALAVGGLLLGPAVFGPAVFGTRSGRAAADEAAEVAAVETAEQAPGEELHPAPEIHGKSLALQVLNFAVLIGLLVYFGGPAVSKALGARHQQLKSELAAAAEARAGAKARLEQQEQRLAALEHEIDDIRAGIKREAEAEKARLIELAEERARRIREETSFLMEQQVKEAKADLRREAARAAVDLAEQMVRRSLDSGDSAAPRRHVRDRRRRGRATEGRADGGLRRVRRAPLRPSPVRHWRRRRKLRGAGAGDWRLRRAAVGVDRAASDPGESRVRRRARSGRSSSGCCRA